MCSDGGFLLPLFSLVSLTGLHKKVAEEKSIGSGQEGRLDVTIACIIRVFNYKQ